MIGEGAFYEYARYVDHYYGTPKEYVLQNLAAGRDVLLEIEIQGARKIKAMFPDTLLLFVTPPDAGTLKERLLGRGTDEETVVLARLARACEEALGIEDYDYLVVNEVLEDCVEKVHSIIQNEHQKVNRNQEFINRIKEELKRFSEGE